MSSHHDKVMASIEAIPGRKLPAMANTLSLAGIAWGVAALLYGLFVGDAAWTTGAVLVAVVYFLGLAQGGVVFAGIMTGTQARWGRPLKRIGEAFAAFLPVAWLALVLFVVLGVDVYPWSPTTFTGEPVALAPHAPGAPPAKEIWLSKGFFMARQILGVALLFLLDAVFLRASLKPDLILASNHLGDKAPAWWAKITGGETDVEAAVEKGLATQYTMVPILGFGYALIFSMIAFDMVMSLDPWWFSNMFGGWIFMSSVWLGFCGIAVATVLGFKWLGLDVWVKANVTHDLGKLMLAGCMFWAYTLFAQILPIYYTNVPEETNFLLVRMMLPQWSWLARTVAVLCFVAPFTILLSRGLKKMQYPFAAVSMLIMFGLFLERTLLVMPSVHLGDAFPWASFLIVSLGIFAGFMGLFVAVVGRYLAQVPAVPVADPLLEDHPWDVHVHAHGHEAHGH